MRDERLNDLLQAKADPRRRADEAFVDTIYAASSPYHRPSAGTEDRPGLDRGHCAALHARRFDPARMTLIVGGDLDGSGRHRASPSACSGPGSAVAECRDDAARRERSPRRADRAALPPAGRGPDRGPHRPRRAAAPDRRLPRGVRDERDPRRAVQLAPEHEASGGEGLHLRRRRRLRHAPGPGRSPPAAR